MDLISVIVPVYNVEKYICRCIDSILHQTYSNLEVILVDDGSKDNSGKLCDDYQERDSRIIVIHKENGGLGYARNTGLEAATGEFVTFIDGDDFIGDSHIEHMYHKIKETNTDTCLGGHTKVYGSKYIKHINVCAGRNFYNDVKEEILPRMCGADSAGNDYIEMSVCMGLFSNKIIKENNLRFVSERELISEDLVFDFLYYPLSKGVCCIDQCEYYYCDNEGSLTTKYRADRFVSQVKLYNAIKTAAENLQIQQLCLPRMNATLIAIARYSIKLEDKFSKEIGNKLVNQHIAEICSNPVLENVFSEYNDRGTKISSRAVNFLIRNKLYLGLRLTMRLKNSLNI